MHSFKVFLAGLLVSGLLGTAQGFAVAPPPTRRTDSGEGVTVKVILLDSNRSGDLRFQGVLDTHSVNLDGYELKKIAVLRDGPGKNHLPKSVESKESRQHRQSTLVLAKMAKGTKRVELVIKGIAEVKERVIRWNLHWVETLMNRLNTLILKALLGRHPPLRESILRLESLTGRFFQRDAGQTANLVTAWSEVRW